VKRVAILISGSGSNMIKLCESMVGKHPARPVIVISSFSGSEGLTYATNIGLKAVVVEFGLFPKDNFGFEAAITEELTLASPDIICLAGFMHILSRSFLKKFANKIINIHPSLLPKYKGLNTHKRAISAGDFEAGCTVHKVTEELDGGPILGQGKVLIDKNETPESLAAKVLKLEHTLYPLVLKKFAAAAIDQTEIILSNS
jgi:phosphoribosylglycinamide formyltransferase-1